MKSICSCTHSRGSTCFVFGLLPPCLCLVVAVGSVAALPAYVQAQTTKATSVSSAATVPQDLRELAEAYMASGDYDKAIQTLLAILATSPTDAITLKADLGLCYKFKKDYAKAVPILAEVGAVVGPRQAQVLYWIDDCYCEQGKFGDAVAHLDKMYVDHPELREHVLERRANRLQDVGRFKDAVADVKALITGYPNSASAKLFRVRLAGLILRTDGLTEEFNTALGSAISAAASEQNPEMAKTLNQQVGGVRLGAEEAMWANGKKSEAVAYLKGMLVDQPDMNAEVLTRLALRHEILGNYADAKADLIEFVRSCPDDERVKMSAVKAVEFAYKAKDKAVDEALQWATSLLNSPDLDSDQAKSLKNELALVFVRTGEFGKAEQLLESLLAKYPDDAQLNLSLGLVHRGKAEYDKAMPLIDEAAKNGQGDVQLEAIQRHEDCLTDQAKYAEAVEYLAEEYAQHPEYGPSILSKRADRLTFKLGDYRQGIADYQEIVSKFPDKPEAKSAELGIAYLTALGLRDFFAGEALLNSFINKYPTDMETIVAYHHLGSLYHMQGKYREAVRMLVEGIKFPDPGNYSAVMMYLLVDSYKHLGLSDEAAKTASRLVSVFRKDDWTQVMLAEHPEYASLLN